MVLPAAKSPYFGYRFPDEVISQATWLYLRFPLSLRMVEEMLAARGAASSSATRRCGSGRSTSARSSPIGSG
jgi:putative transposase